VARLVDYSPTAQEQVLALQRHFKARGRPEAIRNLALAIEDAAERISRAPEAGLRAPRPYPGLVRPGWRWLKTGAYWFAYVSHDQGATVAGVFHESADIPNRL
jgi:plasmid stabilization system protein ParE